VPLWFGFFGGTVGLELTGALNTKALRHKGDLAICKNFPLAAKNIKYITIK
jgi:hypothetical protein